MFHSGDLIQPALVVTALVGRVQPQLEDLVGQAERDDAAAHREDIGVVVRAREPRHIQIVAERGADAGDLIGGDLLALTAAAEHDPAVGARIVGLGLADEIVALWLNTRFEGGRHQRRVDQITAEERRQGTRDQGVGTRE